MAQKKIKGLPLYEARLNGNKCGVLQVSLVDEPAVESDFQAYAEQKPAQLYRVADEDARRVFGVALRADYPIYRNDGGFEYFIVFRPDQIRAFAQKYLAEGRANNVDLHHDFKTIEGAEMVQFFIKDAAKGVAPEGFNDIADGSLFCEYQITDPALWERIKSGEFKGFSVEIIHDEVPVQDTFSKTTNMTFIQRMKAALAKGVEAAEQELSALEAESYGRVATDKGTLIWEGTDDLGEGVAVWAENEDGERVELEDGTYTTSDNIVIVLEGGRVKEIREKDGVDAKSGTTPEETTEDEPQGQNEGGDEEGGDGDGDGEGASEPMSEEAQARIAELEGQVAERDARIAELEQALAELKKKLEEPAGETAHDAFKKSAKAVKSNVFEQIKALR